MLQSDESHVLVQAVRPVLKHELSASTNPATQSEITHITCHLDRATKKYIVLWDDILAVFKDALYIRCETRALPFVKDDNFQAVNPLRIEAVPNSVLGVVAEGQLIHTETALALSSPQVLLQTPSPKIRSPAHDPLAITLEPVPRPPSSLNKRYPQHDPLTIQFSAMDLRSPQYVPDNFDNDDDFDVSDTASISSKFSDKSRLSESRQTSRSVPQSPHTPLPQSAPHSSHTITPQQTNMGQAQMALITSYYQTGRRHETGDNITGTLQNYSAAAEWYLKAASQGHADSQSRLGHMYSMGHGVPHDHAKARRWFIKAAKQGNAQGQYSLVKVSAAGKISPRP
ncbi:hypothetical protein BGX23_011521 [Mortierella sp. AD031]|nr:hypothetical protein BGX23_011521 [Mortierella sp. AD031]